MARSISISVRSHLKGSIELDADRTGQGVVHLLRLYGPLEPWFDQTWRPGEFELLD